MKPKVAHPRYLAAQKGLIPFFLFLHPSLDEAHSVMAEMNHGEHRAHGEENGGESFFLVRVGRIGNPLPRGIVATSSFAR